MKKRAWLGLVPIVCLLCLGTFYSVVREVYGSKQNRQVLVNQLKPYHLLPAIEGDLKKKVITNGLLHDTISYLINMGYLPKAIAKADISCWSLTSDSTAYLIFQQDTFRLTSAYPTLKIPLGIAASGLCSHCMETCSDFRIGFKSH